MLALFLTGLMGFALGAILCYLAGSLIRSILYLAYGTPLTRKMGWDYDDDVKS